MKYSNMKEWLEEARKGNILNAHLCSNKKHIRDCFVWTENPLIYAIVFTERGYDYPLLVSEDLSNISIRVF